MDTPAKHFPFFPASISTVIVPESMWSVKVISSVPRKPSLSNQRRIPILPRTMSVVCLHRNCISWPSVSLTSPPASGISGTLQYHNHPTGTPRAPVASDDTVFFLTIFTRLRLPRNNLSTIGWKAVGRCSSAQRARNLRHAMSCSIPKQSRPAPPRLTSFYSQVYSSAV